MSLYDYTGVIHLHSSFSFDGHTPMEQIIHSAQNNGVDFLMLTDHDHLRARDEGWEGWQGRTLVIVGEEIAPRFNHYLAFNIKEPIVHFDDAEGKNPQKYIDAVKNQGGLGFIAHPDHEGTALFHVKHYCWNDWNINGYSGIGVWDFMTDWQSSLRGYFSGLLSFLFPAYFLQLFDQLGNQCLVPCGQTGDTHHMHIVFNGHLGCFFRRLKHRADIHVKTDIGISRGHHFDAAIMAVLTHFGHQLSGTTAGFLEKSLGPFS